MVSGLFAKIAMGIAAVASAAALWFYADAQLTKKALENQRELTAAWTALSETQERVRVREEGVRTVVERHVTEIERAPNANDPVPPDVALAWANAIDSVRDESHAGASGEPTQLLGPRGGATSGGRPNGGEAKHVLSTARGRISTMQRAPGRSSSDAPQQDGKSSK